MEMQGNPQYDPVLHFKQQGISDEQGSLEKEDILLCIQTEFQMQMLQLFGKNATCIDATHCTNMYDFLLITLLVIDDLVFLLHGL